MKIALIYPPTCDPTAPYLAVPMLTGFLRAAGIDVVPVDANVEAYDYLLRPQPLAAARDRIEERLGELDARAALDHDGQLSYGALWRARGDAHVVPGGIDDATAILRDGERFFDAELYAGAVDTIDAALRVLSAAHAPLAVDFTAYRTPFALTTPEEIARDAAPERDPYDGYITERLIPRLRAAGVGVVGLSVCFPGQLQPAFAFALKLKAPDRRWPRHHAAPDPPARRRSAARPGPVRHRRGLRGRAHAAVALPRAGDGRRAPGAGGDPQPRAPRSAAGREVSARPRQRGHARAALPRL